MLSTYVGRPSPLSSAPRLSEPVGAPVCLKREDLNHTGAHKINNTVGQALLARRMGKRRIIAETGAGQHGVATATVCARFGLECVVYMGEEDMRRQALNVFRMRLMGARSDPGDDRHAHAQGRHERSDSRLGDQRRGQLLHHRLGRRAGAVSAHGARVPGGDRRGSAEADARAVGRLAATVVACVGGGSNAMGIFHAFVDDGRFELVGVEAAGQGLESGEHSASLSRARRACCTGALSYLLQDEDGQVHPAHSISAGLDYPGVGPEHSFLKDSGRAQYVAVTDDEALRGFRDAQPPRGNHPRARDGARDRVGG